MKISKATIGVLENFNSISPKMKLVPGHCQYKTNETQTIFAKATLPEEFPCDFCVGDLQFLIRILKAGKSPTVEFRDGEMIIRDGDNEHRLLEVTERSIQRHIPQFTDLLLENAQANFLIPADAMTAVKKNAISLRYEKIELVCRDGNIYIEAGGRRDRNLARQGGWSRKIGTHDTPFVFTFDIANWIFDPRDYMVSVDAGLAAEFASPDLQYFCVVEDTSWYGEPA